MPPPTPARPAGPTHPSGAAAPLRIAMVAPPWIPVPPPGYGGIESVVELLCDELVARGHDVTLFAAPGSRSRARVCTPLEAAHPEQIGDQLHEADHVAAAWDAIDAGAPGPAPVDVIHDHTGVVAVAMGARAPAPLVQTLHLPLEGDFGRFYARHGHKATLVAISRSQARAAPRGVRIDAVVPNPIAIERWPFSDAKDDYLLWIGRMDPVKGPHRAIEVARRAGRPLVLAGPVQPGHERYFQECVEPHVDGRRIRYAGEVAGERKHRLYARAAAMLMPIRWAEPFGMVMIEALATGTPVIAFAEGAAAEIVADGRNGRLVRDEAEMARAVGDLDRLDPRVCRESVARRYAASGAVDAYEAIYRLAAGRRREPAPLLLRGTADRRPGPERMSPGRPLGSVARPQRR
ncbi:MAG TPA: glycosyltransferase family 4 protein [Capillimicrobium sp.]|nr:glycosyltransferase family 4 protein [Capillimicrobium sp.]